jgi:SAM-dependent methyltransferase
MKKQADPIGKAIHDYSTTRTPSEILVHSDICEDDIIPTEILFRTDDELPKLEAEAIRRCRGEILDVGAGAGAHATILQDLGNKVECIDISPGAVEFMKAAGLNAREKDFFDLEGESYDTVLMLMNGLGLSGTLANLENTLTKAKSLLKEGGRILCDSSDVKFIYTDDDGSLWMDLNSDYYGNFRFQMSFKNELGPWFDWLYVDFDSLFNAAKNVGLQARKVMTQEDHYLAELTLA